MLLENTDIGWLRHLYVNYNKIMLNDRSLRSEGIFNANFLEGRVRSWVLKNE